MNHKQPIAVFGGTGHYGSKIVESLVAKGEPVRVLSRNAEKARQTLGDEPEIIEGNLTSREAIVQTLAGAGAIVIAVSAWTRHTIKQIKAIERDAVLTIFAEAKNAGIERVVYLSGYDMREELLRELNLLKFGEIKLEIEQTLRESDFNWTILGEAPSLNLFFAFVRNGRMAVPGGGPPGVPTVSRNDVGEIAAQTVLRDDLSGQRLRVMGPEALSFPEAAKRIGDITGEPVRFIKMPLLPLNIVSLLMWPFNPYLRYIYWSVKLLNNFPQDLARRVPEDHQHLLDTFDYTPTTFEMEAQKRYKSNQ
jgi:uncharacterized protein YbjT (DUF2867 family)